MRPRARRGRRGRTRVSTRLFALARPAGTGQTHSACSHDRPLAPCACRSRNRLFLAPHPHVARSRPSRGQHDPRRCYGRSWDCSEEPHWPTRRGRSSQSGCRCVRSFSSSVEAVRGSYWTLNVLSSLAEQPLHADAPAPVGIYTDPTTSTPFHSRLTSPDGTQLRLVGTGVRTVSFLNIKVYAVGFYVSEQELQWAKDGKIAGWEVRCLVSSLPRPVYTAQEVSERRALPLSASSHPSAFLQASLTAPRASC